MSKKTVKVAVEDLVVGLYIDLALSWSDHPFTFSKFKIKDTQTIKIIQGLTLKEVSVIVDKSDVAIPKPKPKTETETEQTAETDEIVDSKTPETVTSEDKKSQYLKEKRLEVTKIYKQTAQQIQQLTDDLKIRPVNAIHNIDDLAAQMSLVFSGNDKLMTQMVNLGNGEHTDYNHIANVTMLSLMLGKAEKMDAVELTLLGTASLVHDIGKIKIPLAIKLKTTPLTDAEEKIYQRHTFMGRQLIEKIRTMHPEVLNTIEQHHEFLDGSGYPKGLKEDKISKIVRIVTITNLYDNLCNPSDIKTALTPKIALATLYKKYQGKIDKSLVERLIGILGVYPPGTVVKLTDDSLGLVISGDTSAPMNPNVLIYDPKTPKQDAELISLAEFPELNIKEAVNPGSFPPEIHHFLGLPERIGYMVQNIQDFTKPTG